APPSEGAVDLLDGFVFGRYDDGDPSLADGAGGRLVETTGERQSGLQLRPVFERFAALEDHEGRFAVEERSFRTPIGGPQPTLAQRYGPVDPRRTVPAVVPFPLPALLSQVMRVIGD